MLRETRIKIKTRESAIRKLDNLFNNAEDVYIIHYACENFSRPDGKAPRITGIIVKNLASNQTDSFCIYLKAQQHQFDVQNLTEANLNQCEKELLSDFCQYLNKRRTDWWVHWNMVSSTFGFQAIEHRCRSLNCPEWQGVPSHNKLVDLPELLEAMYGSEFIENPKLPSLIKHNNLGDYGVLSGKEEPEYWERKEFVKVHNSTLRKADILKDILTRANLGTLKTKGIRPWLLVAAMFDHPLVTFSLSTIGLISSALSIWQARTSIFNFMISTITGNK